MKSMKTRILPLGAAIATVSMMGTVAVPSVAEASSKGRRNTTIGLGAAAAHQLLKGKTTNGLVLGAGTAYAYKRYKDAQRDENRQRSASAYRSTYRNGSTYRSGSAYGGSSVRPAASRTRTTTTRSTTAYTAPRRSNTRVTPATFIFTGPLSNAGDFTDRSITVNHNGTLRPTVVPENAAVIRHGDRVSLSDINRGETVRVTAIQTSPNQWRASRIEVVEPMVADTATWSEDRVVAEDRIITRQNRIRRDRLGGADRTLPAGATSYTGVGIVQSIDRGSNSFDVKVGNNTRTVFAEDSMIDGVTSVTDLRRGDRVRVVGDIFGRDVFATRIVMLD